MGPTEYFLEPRAPSISRSTRISYHKIIWAVIFAFLTQIPAPAHASTSLISTNLSSTANYGLNATYWAAQEFTAGSNTNITSVDIPVSNSSNILVLRFRADSSGLPGAVLATWTNYSYNSTVSPPIQTFTGSLNVTSGTHYWISLEMPSGSLLVRYNSTLSYTGASGWSTIPSHSVAYSNNAASSWAIDTSVASLSFQLNGSLILTPLSTPSAPLVSNGGTGQILVSETSTTSNALSFIINIYQSDGVTFVESSTATAAGITSPNTLAGLTPNSTYGVSVTAIGDGATYSNSAASPLTYITISLGATTINISISGTGYQFEHAGTTYLTSTTTNIAGTVTFYLNGRGAPKKIFGCANLTVISGSTSCLWKPNFHGFGIINASFTPSSGNYSASISSYLNLYVGPRTVTRGS